MPLPGGGTVPGPFGYGGFWRRLGSYVVDVIILDLIAGLIISLTATAGSTAIALVGFLLAFVWFFGYQIFFIRKYDATPGQMALGLKVLRADGAKLSVGRIIGRFFGFALAAVILYIGLIMVAFDDEKRGLHDRMCDTRVIKTR